MRADGVALMRQGLPRARRLPSSTCKARRRADAARTGSCRSASRIANERGHIRASGPAPCAPRRRAQPTAATARHGCLPGQLPRPERLPQAHSAHARVSSRMSRSPNSRHRRAAEFRPLPRVWLHAPIPGRVGAATRQNEPASSLITRIDEPLRAAQKGRTVRCVCKHGT